MKEKKVFIYRDELNDDFFENDLPKKKIGDDYVYIQKSLWKRFTHFFWYRVVATPAAWLYLKIAFGHRIVNREVLKLYNKSGVFLYGNHTQEIGDAFIPTMLVFPKEAYVIVHPSNLSLPVIGKLNPSLGALPLPDTLRANRNFVEAIDKRIGEGRAVFIYPEAHVWPYYTKIRPFTDTSFHYPVKTDAPVFCFTNTYQKRKWSSRPRIVTYIDGPFLAEKDGSAAERRAGLRDKVYRKMCERSLMSDTEYAEYRFVGEKSEENE